MSSCCINCCFNTAFLVVALVLGGCASEEAEEALIATIPPVYSVVTNVAGGDVGILISGAASPHSYEPRPSDARRAARASLLIYAAPELDGWAAALDAPARLALLGLLPDTLRRSATGGRGVDPHFWMDPLAVRSLAPVLADTLCSLGAGRCNVLEQNAAVFADKLLTVHDSLTMLMAPVRGTSVVYAHPFLGYFSDRYGLKTAAIIEELSGSEPSPRDMQRIIDQARASSARAVLTQPQHSSLAAEVVAEALGIPVVELDPVTAAEDLPDLLYFNAREILDALYDPPPSL